MRHKSAWNVAFKVALSLYFISIFCARFQLKRLNLKFLYHGKTNLNNPGNLTMVLRLTKSNVVDVSLYCTLPFIPSLFVLKVSYQDCAIHKHFAFELLGPLSFEYGGFWIPEGIGLVQNSGGSETK